MTRYPERSVKRVFPREWGMRHQHGGGGGKEPAHWENSAAFFRVGTQSVGAQEASGIRTKPGRVLSAEGETRRHGASDV